MSDDATKQTRPRCARRGRRIGLGEEIADLAAELGVTRQALYQRVNLQMEAENEH